ncbi:uncharacterized protein LOC128681499 [Plodia interpunctella]|uniref:uncharacterized protein LOC128681499 n=1 Tax=Plodia interpunctella TaxID=58824 RepID=UPI00236889D8|nr:uncharacterized protein LOC128681499 [Plodia interpunctella]
MEPQKRKQYASAQLEAALLAINEGTSIYEASKTYGIPRTTLRDKRNNKYINEHCGKQTVLTKEEEKRLVDWIFYLGKSGFPVTKDQLLETVAKLVENLNRSNPFKDGVPGKGWFLKFMARHPTISRRITQNLPTSRSHITEEAVRAWFNRVHSYFEQNNLLDVLEDPSRIFNCDETGFFLCPKGKQVLVRRGSKKVYSRVANDEKECLTVLVNVSADAAIAPPMVLYPYKRLPKNIVPTVPSGWGIGHTESGWMNMAAFYEYVANCFYPWLIQHNIQFPVALFLDGHTSHISLPLTVFCKEKGIILIALLPNATHVLQPLDVSVFRPVKGTWRTVVHDFRVQNNFAKLRRIDFAPQVDICLKKTLVSQTIKNGFQCCGLYPFGPDNVNYDKLLTKNANATSEESGDNADDISSHGSSTVTGNEKSVDDTEKFKQQFERRLSPEVLLMFQKSGSVWNGDETYKKLFEFWRDINPIDNTPLQQTFDNNLELGDTTLVNNIGEEETLTYEVSASGCLVPNRFNTVSNNVLMFPMDELLSPIISKESDTISLLSTQPESNLLEYVNEIPPKTITTSTDCVKELNSEDHNARTSTPKQSNKNFSDEPMLLLNKSHSDDTLFTTVNNETPCKSIQNSSHSRFIPKELNLTTPFKNALFFPKVDTKSNKRVSKKITPTVAISDEFMEYQKKAEEKKAQEEEKKKIRKEKLQRNKIERVKKQADLRKAKERKNMGAVSKPTSVRKHNTSKALEIRRNTTSSSESESDSVLIPRQNNYKVKTKNAIHSGYASTSARVLPNTSSSDNDELHVPKTVSYKRHIIFPSDSESDNIF